MLFLFVGVKRHTQVVHSQGDSMPGYVGTEERQQTHPAIMQPGIREHGAVSKDWNIIPGPALFLHR